ncbi:MAG TPA: DnaD domain protein [Candidatus Salinicoccus stercoripullorum]|uniref:DnaD domain protein n=1 Tax=Candidatus Salinicoccus stercoripullorum TaxID=2838756 RepID=A0A9D1U0C7_9STAP|nr:DnaD domain protein [Candidatus Salinicoccus stercoripullorum]
MLERFMRYINVPVNKILIDKYGTLGIDEQSLVILIRLMDIYSTSDKLPEFGTLAAHTTMSENDISKIMENLIQDSLIEIETVKDQGKFIERFSLDPLFKKLIKAADPGAGEKKQDPSKIRDLFEYVELLYGRVISPNEFQRMNSWLDDSGHSPEKIKEAIDLAYQNQVTSLQYVERILNSTDNRKEEQSSRRRMPVRSWLEGEDVFD